VHLVNKNLALHPALTVVDGWGGFAGFVFTHGHFGFHKKRAAPVCMILVISLEARPAAGAIKATQATQATDLMVFPAVSDHSRPLVRLAFICRPPLIQTYVVPMDNIMVWIRLPNLCPTALRSVL
jgi:hypothetical protein